MRAVAAVLLLSFSLPGVLYANPAPGGDGDRIPPKEAFQACNGKKAGDTVSFVTPRGEKTSGKCRMIPARLAAVPDRPPPQDGKPPPPPPPQ